MLVCYFYYVQFYLLLGLKLMITLNGSFMYLSLYNISNYVLLSVYYFKFYFL